MGMEVTLTAAKLPTEEEGSGGYLASLEVTHHLQCLVRPPVSSTLRTLFSSRQDMLRKATYREYYASFDPAFQVEDEVLMNQLGKTIPFN